MVEWSSHCHALLPAYIKAAENLRRDGQPVQLAAVDALTQVGLTERFGVVGYPTLKLLSGSCVVSYDGGREADDITAWVVENIAAMNVAARRVQSPEQLNKLLLDEPLVVIGFFKVTFIFYRISCLIRIGL